MNWYILPYSSITPQSVKHKFHHLCISYNQRVLVDYGLYCMKAWGTVHSITLFEINQDLLRMEI